MRRITSSRPRESCRRRRLSLSLPPSCGLICARWVIFCPLASLLSSRLSWSLRRCPGLVVPVRGSMQCALLVFLSVVEFFYWSLRRCLVWFCALLRLVSLGRCVVALGYVVPFSFLFLLSPSLSSRLSRSSCCSRRLRVPTHVSRVLSSLSAVVWTNRVLESYHLKPQSGSRVA